MSGWRKAKLEEVGTTRDSAFWLEWTDDPGYAARWHMIGRELGVTGFGVNAVHGAEGEELIVRHDEVEFGGQEELYVVVVGRARFSCDGDEVELGQGEALYLRPEVVRRGVALATPTVLVMIGGTPGLPYEVPDWASD